MFLPESYDNALSDILDIHAKYGIIPSEFCVKYLDIKQDFQQFFSDQKITHISKVLDIGGRTLPYAYQEDIAIDIYEPREKYHNAIIELNINGNKVALKDIQIQSYDLVLINREIGGLQNIDKHLYHLNQKFTSDIPVYAYSLELRQDSHGENRYLDDGSIYDHIEAQKLYKSINSHMHVGVDSYKYMHVEFYNLCRDY